MFVKCRRCSYSLFFYWACYPFISKLFLIIFFCGFYFYSCYPSILFKAVIFFYDPVFFSLLFVAYLFYFILFTISAICNLVSLISFLWSFLLLLAYESMMFRFLEDNKLFFGREWNRGNYNDLGGLYTFRDYARRGNSTFFCIFWSYSQYIIYISIVKKSK